MGKECQGMAEGAGGIGCFSVVPLMLKGGISRMPERGPAAKDSHSGFGGWNGSGLHAFKPVTLVLGGTELGMQGENK